MASEFINPKFVFSLYPNLLTVDKPTSNIDITQLIEIIKYGYIKDLITTLRGPISKKEYDLIKKDSIPCVTLSGTFTHRESKSLLNHSGLLQVDIDKLDDYDEHSISYVRMITHMSVSEVLEVRG
jgi:hypothetical protein